MDPAVQNGYDGPVTIVGATYEQFATEGETKASFNENGTFGWETTDQAKFEITNDWYQSTAQDISADKSKCFFQIVGDLSTDMVATLPADIYPVRYNAQSTNDGLKVTIPASRTWVKDQSYATMLGFGANNGGNISYSFSHLGGLAKIKVNGVPANATKFVFKTKGFKISGEFEAGKINTSGGQTISTAVASSSATNVDDFSEDEETYSLTFTSDDISSNSGVMEFNVPLPCGNYTYGFAFCFKDNGGTVIYSFVGSSSQTVERTDRLCLPTINIVGGGGENLPTKSVQNIPAGYKGDFLLAEAENVLLKIAPEANANDINLKYNSGQKPSNLEINIVEGETAGTFAGTISGNLPQTHVDFTKGEIANVEMTTSASTFEIIYPATISTKLTVTGGNVKIKGAEVKAIEVAQNAVASEETKAPVQISMEKYAPTGGSEQTPKVTEKIEANADVVVAPEEGVTVTVDAGDNVQVANEGAGKVKDKSDQPIETKAAAKIGEVKYITLADAIAAVKDGETIKLVADVEKAAGISVAEDKNFTVDFDGHTYAMECPGAGSEGTKTIGFQLLKGSNIVFKGGEGKAGTIKCTDANKSKTWSSSDASKGIAMIIQNYANLTLDGITIDATNIAHNGVAVRYALSNNSGNVEYKGATSIITAAGDYAFDVCKYSNYDAPTVTWNSTGSVTGGIELSGGEFVVAKPLALTQPIKAKAAAKLTVNETITPSSTNWTTTGTKDALVVVNRGGNLTIEGNGKISNNTNANVYSAVKLTESGEAANASKDTEKAELTVNGSVTLEGDYYGITGNGSRHGTEITVNGGTIKGTHTNDNLGIFHPQDGNLTITGGTIEGYSSAVEVRAGTANISGGSFTSTANSFSCAKNGSGNTTVGAAIAIAQHNTRKTINVTVSGGTFKGIKAVSVEDPEDGEPQNVNVVINGGTFSDLNGVEYVAEGGTYTLANDVNLGENILEINSCKTFEINLNGKTLTGRTNIKHGNVTFKNGTIKTTGNVQALNVYGSATSAESYSVVNVASDVTVNAGVYAVCVFGATAGGTGYGAVANIAGTITTTGDGQNGAVFVSGNLGKGETATDWAVSSKNAVNIQNGAKITSSTDAALALNGSATVTVASGAELTGATAIAAKRGKLIVNGGTITGTGTCNGNPTGNKNGIENTGSAVSATATYKNDGPLSVEIKGGTFTSNAYTILNNHDGCTFQISGGDFKTEMETDGIAVYARLGSVNITGGTFENNSNSEATLHVGCPTAESSGLQPKLTISGENTVVKNIASDSYTYGGKPLVVNMANQLTYKAVEISGGKFYYRNPSQDDNVTGVNGNFLADGYSVSGDETNGWTVAVSQQN